MRAILLTAAFGVVVGIASFGSTTSAEAANCGGINQRLCKIYERIRFCDYGLVENYSKGRCEKSARTKIGRSGKNCGQENQRPCGLVEIPRVRPCVFDSAPKQEVERKARYWLNALGTNGLVLNAGPLEATYEIKDLTPLPNYIRVSDHGLSFTIGFDTLVSSEMSVETLQKHVKFVANNGIPIPALTTPGWTVEALTPSSHAEDGIEILSAGPSRMKLRITYPRFFAIHGQDLRADALNFMDKPMPESCFFQIRQDFPGEIIVDLAIANW